MKIIKNEAQFAEWFKKNYKNLGYEKIVRGDISRFPDFIMLKDGKEVKVELETVSSNFIAHKHSYEGVDEIVCLTKDVELEKPVIEVKELKYEGNVKVTLSLDSKTYEDFKKFCEDNAIMLSKKVENVMKELMKKKFLLFGFLLSIYFVILASSAIFQDLTQGDFNNGTYENTTHNGTGVVLVGNNLSGTFTSKVFDAGSLALWNNLSWNGENQQRIYLFAVDNGGKVYASTNSGATWTQKNASYGRTGDTQDMFSDSVGNLYILASSSKEVWKSTDGGVSWNVVNKTFSSNNLFAGTGDLNNSIYVSSGASGNVYRSADGGITWSSLGSFGGGVAKGMTVNMSNAIYVVDGSGGVYASTNSGATWTQKNSNYGRTSDTVDMFSDNSSNLYVVATSNREVWKSTDGGVSWSVVNKTFSGSNLLVGASDTEDNLYTIGGSSVGVVFKSSNAGDNWNQVNNSYNGGSNAASGMISVLKNTNLTFQVKNCSLPDCSDGIFVGLDGNSNLYFTNFTNTINLTGRYFQYKFYFNSLDINLTSLLRNVSVDYTILDSTPPQVTINFPISGGAYRSLPLNFNVSLNENGSVKYSLDGGLHNVTMSSLDSLNFNATNSSIAEGNYVFRVYANDSVGNNNNSASASFIFDTTKPSVVIVSPQNTSYNSGNVLINYTASDSLSGVQACWYNIDSFPFNLTLANCGTTSISVGEGSHNLIVYANDSAGNVNSSSVAFSVDSIPPQWSNLQQSIPSVYSDSTLAYFNVTWTDSVAVQSVLFESNFSGIVRNYTMYSLGGNVYGFNASLPAGGFYWKSYANDSLGNLNSTTTQNFNVAKADANPVLLINENSSDLNISYGVQTNATAISSGGYNVKLYRNSVEVSNPEVRVLGAGFFNYTAVAESNQNFTGFSATFFVNVSKAESNLNLLINGSASDLTASYGSLINTTAFETASGDSDVIYSFYRDGVLVSTGTFVSDAGIFGVGIYNYTFNSTEGQNYSSGSVSRVLNITKASVLLSLTLNGFSGDVNQTFGSVSFVNGSSSVSGLQLNLYKDEINILNGTSNVSYSALLGASVYNFTLSYSGNENYSSAVIRRFLTIEKATPNLYLTLNGYSSDTSVPAFSIVEINATSLNPSPWEISLYEDGILVDSGSSYLIAERNYSTLGDKVWTAEFLESENYSALNLSYIVSVIDPNSPQYSILVSSPSSPAQYSLGGTYLFNSTWIDDIGIDEVTLEFEENNYSLANGQVNNSGNVYFVSLSGLGVGTYHYRWIANDTSGNVVYSPLQMYEIKRAPTVLIIDVSPNQVVSYGTTSSVTCFASNVEVTPQLYRDASLISILPDQQVFAAGSYVYSCLSDLTQNYSAGNAGQVTLNVQKANPVINLSLNGIASDLNLSSSGGVVNISANLVLPLSGELNLSVDGVVINVGGSFVENQSLFNVVGSHIVSVSFGGNENYSSGSATRIVTVSAPPVPSGEGGSSGGGGGGGGIAQPPENVSEDRNANLVVVVEREIILKKGTSSEFNVEVFSNDKLFLNNCKLVFSGESASWISNNQQKGIAKGEKFIYSVRISVPEEGEPGIYSANVIVQCDEGRKSAEFDVVTYRNSFEPRILDYVREGNKLRVSYELREFAGVRHDIAVEYFMLDFDNLPRLRGTENVVLGAGEKIDREFVFELPKDSFGEFVFEALFNDGVVETKASKQIFLPTGSGGLTGLVSNVGEDNKKTLGYFGALVLILGIGIFGFYLAKKLKRGKIPMFTKPKKVLLDFDAGTQHL